MSISELHSARANLKVQPLHMHQQEEFHTILLLVVHLINLLCCIQKDDSSSLRFKRTVHRLARLHVCSATSDKSLLHLAVDKKTSSVAEEFYSHFPSVHVVRVLLECGADVNAVDADGNTPLHVCGQQLVDGSRPELETMVQCLLDNGAHADAANKKRQLASTEIGHLWPKWNMLEHVTLKCLAARAVKEFGIPYEDEIPQSLVPYLQMH